MLSHYGVFTTAALTVGVVLGAICLWLRRREARAAWVLQLPTLILLMVGVMPVMLGAERVMITAVTGNLSFTGGDGDTGYLSGIATIITG